MPLGELLPDSSILEQLGTRFIEGDHGLKIDLVNLLDAMNDRIEFLFDRDHRIGHSYLIGIRDFAGLERVFLDEIIPLLQEYFYGDWQKIQLVLADLEETTDVDGHPKARETAIISYRIESPGRLLGVADDSLPMKRLYEVPPSINPESVIKIYES